MKDRKKMSEQRKGRLQKLVLMTMAMMTLLYSNGFIVYASGNYGQNAAYWLLDQVFWIVLVAVIIIAALCVAKKNNTGAIVTIVAGGAVLFFIKNPTAISDIGNDIMSKVIK